MQSESNTAQSSDICAKKQKIQWDEETIAEHDKERGSRQKIDEAPTPFRYGSESDQSECESDGERLGKTHTETSPGGSVKRVNFRSPSNSQTDLSGSWGVLNAKLQYEKQQQEQCLAGVGAGQDAPAAKAGNNDVQQRREFYQSGQNGGVTKRVAMGGNVEDLQTNFGEIMHSAPAAWSPQFTRKQFRVGGGKKSTFVDTAEPAPPRVFTFVDTARGAPSYPEQGHVNAGSAGGPMGIDTEEEEGKIHKEQFMNKRAGHYNEFKMLQAMREKMAAEDEDEDMNMDRGSAETYGGAGAENPDAESSLHSTTFG
ncbi:hypothetical protein B484DRAFT_420834 [Ochromonadaceae sp. CCMP2298]|nr:hypothetical protein B484DRAFT_420834 [Ochromonadaceae sp. CCMP2298]|mmetsp:Transcript_27506/g.60905  ORF Transcript_27506/g.60905 Transcript_27506/m.60905 type:complete len:312 (+) Transcript_27506:209-1144(+)|eukprot:CAMPEP_0173190938 /NCGR_PEP_ID=MMETSP1141-20130122/12615_1 /TAXON_ID=483371 /ORGANISM="non described non described, Strain CCMP2298" /LENGTH=311 /DNA_ID=CAMNT_0014115087 /DNA_START=175 /DNA_END=1110 /DNA_ORIENTATION=-